MQEDCRMQCEQCGEWQYPDDLEIYGDHAACIGYCNMAYLQSLPEEYYDEFIARGHEDEFRKEYEGHCEYDDKADFCYWKKDDGFEDFVKEWSS